MRFIVKMWQKKQCPMVLTPLIAKARQLYVSLYPSVCERALEIQPFIWPWGMLSWSWLLEYSQRLRGIRIWLLTFGCCRESVVIKLFRVIFWFKCKLPTWHLFWNWDKTFSVTLPFFLLIALCFDTCCIWSRLYVVWPKQSARWLWNPTLVPTIGGQPFYSEHVIIPSFNGI